MQAITVPRSSTKTPLALTALPPLLAFVLVACGSSSGVATPGKQASSAANEAPPSAAGESPAIHVAEVLRPSIVDVRVANAQGQALGIGSSVIYQIRGARALPSLLYETNAPAGAPSSPKASLPIGLPSQGATHIRQGRRVSR